MTRSESIAPEPVAARGSKIFGILLYCNYLDDSAWLVPGYRSVGPGIVLERGAAIELAAAMIGDHLT
jgi:hypothetical protein